ncbi:MAG: response regulator [Bdellovibrionaceae bacterium]|nr:response regulator [Pseudobdellovibrionaceae bacterium]MBX3035226.1 response regulator [Pseudobdellovibrionaceae bacterium]
MVDIHPEFLDYQDFHFRQRSLDPIPAPRVLVVEDDEVALEALSRQIRRYDPSLEVIAAKSMSEALQIMQTHPPDLLITDYYLDSDSTAVDLLRMAEKANKPLADILVVSTGAPLPALFAAEREGLRIKFVKKPVDRFLLYRFLQFDLDRGYYL